MGWKVVERVVHLGKRSNDQDQQDYDHADFFEIAHDRLSNEYPCHVWVLAKSAVLMATASLDLITRRNALTTTDYCR